MSKGKKRPLVDERSFDLAEHFLQDEPHTEDDKWDLAGDIQRVVEDWFDVKATESARHSAPTAEYQHGRDCPKVPHTSATHGYLHLATDDGPYDVDGLMYCGRCHTWLR